MKWALRQVGLSLLTLVFVLVFNFFLFRMLPGDPVRTYTRGRQSSAGRCASMSPCGPSSGDM